ncbi:MAG: AI-2E family transporter [Spirochaetia bacterium]
MNYQKVQNALLTILVLVAVGAVLHLTASFVIPFVIAFLLSFVLSPAVEAMRKIKIPRIIAIILVIFFLLGIGFLVGLFMNYSIQSFIYQLPKYQNKFENAFREIAKEFPLLQSSMVDFDWFSALGRYLLSFSANFIGFLGGMILMFVFLFFLLLEKPYLRNKMVLAFRNPTTDKLGKILEHINQQIGRYLTVKLFISLATGILVWVSFYIIGLDFAFIWGVLAFVFNFIPSIGSIAIGVLSIAFSFVQFFPAWDRIIAVAVAMLTIQTILGNILDPKFQGDRLKLSPVVILFSLFFWGWLWGIAGMFLAVPLTAAIKISFENIPGFEPFGQLMGTGKIPRRRKKDRAAAE